MREQVSEWPARTPRETKEHRNDNSPLARRLAGPKLAIALKVLKALLQIVTTFSFFLLKTCF